MAVTRSAARPHTFTHTKYLARMILFLIITLYLISDLFCAHVISEMDFNMRRQSEID